MTASADVNRLKTKKAKPESKLKSKLSGFLVSASIIVSDFFYYIIIKKDS